MLDTEFLRSLGIREELLPPPGPQAGEIGGNLPPGAANGRASRCTGRTLGLSEEELEKLLKEEHSQENPYVYCMPDGIHKAAVYPDKVRGEYDLECPAKEFINLVALARDPEIEGMLAYKPRHGPWHSVDPNPSQENEGFTAVA